MPSGLNPDTGADRLLRIAAAQKRSCQFAAAAATCAYTELRLQIAHGGGAGSDGFFDFVICNGVTNAYKHEVLLKYS